MADYPWMSAPHEPAEQIDSSQPVVCRFCGAVKPPMGWLTYCLRPSWRWPCGPALAISCT
jgi:hypothetical protein